MADEIKVLLITTGGTIAGQVAATDGYKENAAKIREAEEFPTLLRETIDSLQQVCKGRRILVDSINLCNVDSSDILHKQWMDLASLVKKHYDEYDSFVITHGTNTLGYTCAALSFALANPAKPIVLTGSQVPAGVPGSDALSNLENSLRIAVWNEMDEKKKRIQNPLGGVMAVFGSHIITGTRVKKNTEFDYDAFKSFGAATIGRIGRIIHLDKDALLKHMSYLSTPRYQVAAYGSQLRCVNEFDMNIASVTEFPGMSSDILRRLVDHNGVRGIILRSFGAGDPSSVHRPTFEYLQQQRIPVVITTQAPNGYASMSVNEPGKQLRDRRLGIPAYDMSIESQTTKLAWLLAQMKPGGMSYDQVCDAMIENLRGEINVIWE